jgi:hypothetical protein
VVRKRLINRIPTRVQPHPSFSIDDRGSSKRTHENDIGIDVNKHVRGRFLGKCELDQLLHEPSSNRSSTSLDPKVRTEADLPQVEPAQPERQHVFGRHDGRSVALSGRNS